MTKRVLISGAGGYIGSILVRQLLDAGDRVIAMDRFFFGLSTLDQHRGHPNLTILRRDVRDITRQDMAGVDVVFDLAALSNDPCGDLDPNLTRAINHRGRARVALTAKEAGVQRYVLASSCSVYGDGDGVTLTEDSPTAPQTVYASCNINAENDAMALADNNFVVSALRNATVFGVSPRMRFDLVINIMTLHAYNNARIVVLGGGKQWRPLIHVSDVARSFVAVMNAPHEAVNGQVFNTGVSNHQVRNIAAIVREVLPFPVDIQIAPDDKDKRDYRVSFEKLAHRVGFSPSVTVEQGVQEVYDALKFGRVEASARTSTVRWYRTILEAKSLVDDITLDGRLL